MVCDGEEEVKRKCCNCGEFLEEDDEWCYWCESEDFEYVSDYEHKVDLLWEELFDYY